MDVLVIDSGYGGLPVLNALKKKYPQNQYTYIADTQNFPYGNKDIDYLQKCINRIKKEIYHDRIYFACNTLSAIYYHDEEYLEVIKPVIEYVNNKAYDNVMLIATQNTINSSIFQLLINSNVITQPLQELINKIENNDNYEEVFNDFIANIPKEVDCLILGCTHFLLIKDRFKEKLSIDVICVDELI